MIDFIVEPGSNGAVKAREPRAAVSLEAVAFTSFGSTVGQSATASSLPVATSSTTTEPHFAPVCFARAASTCWAYHCRSRSIVSRTVPPGLAAFSTTALPGIAVPSSALSYSVTPSEPARQALSEYSRPACGWPCAPTKPTRLPATAPLG